LVVVSVPNFAIYESTVILNVIVADSQETAEAVSGMNAIETEGEPWIGWVWDEGSQSWVRPGPPAGE